MGGEAVRAPNAELRMIDVGEVRLRTAGLVSARRWLGVPTLFDAVAQYADNAYPDKLAIISESDGPRTYGELADRSARLAWVLRERMGLDTGDRISIWMHQRPEWIGAAHAGVPSRW